MFQQNTFLGIPFQPIVKFSGVKWGGAVAGVHVLMQSPFPPPRAQTLQVQVRPHRALSPEAPGLPPRLRSRQRHRPQDLSGGQNVRAPYSSNAFLPSSDSISPSHTRTPSHLRARPLHPPVQRVLSTSGSLLARRGPTWVCPDDEDASACLSVIARQRFYCCFCVLACGVHSICGCIFRLTFKSQHSPICLFLLSQFFSLPPLFIFLYSSPSFFLAASWAAWRTTLAEGWTSRWSTVNPGSRSGRAPPCGAYVTCHLADAF